MAQFLTLEEEGSDNEEPPTVPRDIVSRTHSATGQQPWRIERGFGPLVLKTLRRSDDCGHDLVAVAQAKQFFPIAAPMQIAPTAAGNLVLRGRSVCFERNFEEAGLEGHIATQRPSGEKRPVQKARWPRRGQAPSVAAQGSTGWVTERFEISGCGHVRNGPPPTRAAVADEENAGGVRPERYTFDNGRRLRTVRNDWFCDRKPPATPDRKHAEPETKSGAEDCYRRGRKVQQVAAYHDNGAGQRCNRVDLGAEHDGHFGHKHVPHEPATDSRQHAQKRCGDRAELKGKRF